MIRTDGRPTIASALAAGFDPSRDTVPDPLADRPPHKGYPGATPSAGAAGAPTAPLSVSAATRVQPTPGQRRATLAAYGRPDGRVDVWIGTRGRIVSRDDADDFARAIFAATSDALYAEIARDDAISRALGRENA